MWQPSRSSTLILRLTALQHYLSHIWSAAGNSMPSRAHQREYTHQLLIIFSCSFSLCGTRVLVCESDPGLYVYLYLLCRSKPSTALAFWDILTEVCVCVRESQREKSRYICYDHTFQGAPLLGTSILEFLFAITHQSIRCARQGDSALERLGWLCGWFIRQVIFCPKRYVQKLSMTPRIFTHIAELSPREIIKQRNTRRQTLL